MGRWIVRLTAWFASLLLGMAFFAFVSLGLLLGYRVITTNSFFQLTNIEIHGMTRLDRGEVMNFAGVELGRNSLALGMDNIRTRLLTNAWIEEASVKRVLPGTLIIRIMERKPLFWANKEGRMYYVDQVGRYIAPVDSNGFTPLPMLMAESGADAFLGMLGEAVEELNSTDIPFRLAEADWVRLTRNHALEIAFGQPQRQLIIDLDNFSKNLDRMSQVWADLGRRGELPMVSGIRVHGENVWVSMGSES